MELLEKGLALLVGGLIIWGLWRAVQPRPVFVVRIVHGEPRPIFGRVTQAFLQRLREVAANHGVTTGRVTGLVSRGRIRLQFSRQIPEPGRQQLRNWWAVSGWLAGKTRA